MNLNFFYIEGKEGSYIGRGPGLHPTVFLLGIRLFIVSPKIPETLR
jgi:hypothetical protein